MAKIQFVECYQCGGATEFDEEGKAYACYVCCDTGRVEAETADAYYRDLDDARTTFAPRRLGAFQLPAREDDWMMCDEEAAGRAAAESVPGHRLFTGLTDIAQSMAAARGAASRAAFAAERGFDDIPF